MASFNQATTQPNNPVSGRSRMATSSPRKVLFRSPVSVEDIRSTDVQMDRLEVEQLTETCLKKVQGEVIEQRLNDLRKKLTWLSETDWQYRRPEELIGLEK